MVDKNVFANIKLDVGPWVEQIKEFTRKMNLLHEPTPIYDTLVEEFWPVVSVKSTPGGVVQDKKGEDINESIYRLF
jgi:hypothetical protein